MAPPVLLGGQDALDEGLRTVRRGLGMLSVGRDRIPVADMVDALESFMDERRDLLHERSLQICSILAHGPMRYNALLEALAPISTRTLSAKLAALQLQGLVTRTHHDEQPPRVEYALSPHGQRYADLVFASLLLVHDCFRRAPASA